MLRSRTCDDRCFPAEVSGNGLPDIGAHTRNLRCFRPEDDVAALDIDLDSSGTGVLEDRDEVAHPQLVSATDVDSTQECNLDRWFPKFARWGYCWSGPSGSDDRLVLTLGVCSRSYPP